MKHLMIVLVLMIGFAPIASARPRPGRECAEVNQRRYNFGLEPDIRCTGEAYGRAYDYDRYYSHGHSYYEGRRYRQNFGRDAAYAALDVASHGVGRWIESRIDRRAERATVRQETIVVTASNDDRLRERIDELEYQLQNQRFESERKRYRSEIQRLRNQTRENASRPKSSPSTQVRVKNRTGYTVVIFDGDFEGRRVAEMRPNASSTLALPESNFVAAFRIWDLDARPLWCRAFAQGSRSDRGNTVEIGVLGEECEEVSIS